jgi:uncharacterized protein YxeA
VGFDYNARSYDDQTEEERQDFSGTYIDRDNPSRNYLRADGKSTVSSSISLIDKHEIYAEAMVALMEVV